MPSPTPSSLTPEAAAWDAAVALAPQRPVAIERRLGGGNNRLYRVTAADGTSHALKWYPKPAGDQRDRLGTEFAALNFLHRCHITNVPQPFAADRQAGFALYEWIDGECITAPLPQDIDAALAFAASLHTLCRHRDATSLPLASEACLSASDIIEQIDRRLRRLNEIAEDEPELRAFLQEEFTPLRRSVVAWVRDAYCARGWDFDAPIESAKRSLSPSDFGFHNAIRRPDGNLVFIDFEYFGWDDPIKLVADFIQHPGMSLSPALLDRFRQGACRLYGTQADFASRLELLEPLIGLRWCMILLNEFLPERWRNRALAGVHTDGAIATRTQLDRARSRATSVSRYWDDHRGAAPSP